MSKQDTTPKGPRGVIQGEMANNSVKTVDCLAELFDNSIDGGARTIAGKVSNVTKRGRGSFVIIDDGCGVGRLASLMTQGESSRPANGEEHIGRFAQAFRTLPAVRFEDVLGLEDPVRVRQRTVDGRNYIYIGAGP